MTDVNRPSRRDCVADAGLQVMDEVYSSVFEIQDSGY